MNNIFICCACFLLMSCQSKTESVESFGSPKVDLSLVTKENNSSEIMRPDDDTDAQINHKSNFNDLKCNDVLKIWYGALQSLKKGQNKELYVFGQCISENNSFDIIWVMNISYEDRAKYDIDELKSEFARNAFKKESHIKNGFMSFVFKLPLKEIKDPLLDDPYIFPCKVEVLYNSGNDDVLLSRGFFNVDSWEDYVQLQYNQIFD
jgi:hypothetical protein